MPRRGCPAKRTHNIRERSRYIRFRGFRCVLLLGGVFFVSWAQAWGSLSWVGLPWRRTCVSWVTAWSVDGLGPGCLVANWSPVLTLEPGITAFGTVPDTHWGQDTAPRASLELELAEQNNRCYLYR